MSVLIFTSIIAVPAAMWVDQAVPKGGSIFADRLP